LYNFPPEAYVYVSIDPAILPVVEVKINADDPTCVVLVGCALLTDAC
jgi:hypothetical protein